MNFYLSESVSKLALENFLSAMIKMNDFSTRKLLVLCIMKPEIFSDLLFLEIVTSSIKKFCLFESEKYSIDIGPTQFVPT